MESRFRQIIVLPIPGTKSFRVLNSLQWPELIDYFENRVPSLSAPVRFQDWTSFSEQLLEIARDEKPDVRSRAITRLSALFAYGCLDETASKKLAEAFWSHLTAEGLPQVERFLPSACLYLPEPEPNLSTERFRAYACADRPTSGVNVSLMRDWIVATLMPAESPTQRRRFVDWTNEEVRVMVARMKDWWDRLDIAAETQRESGHAGSWLRALGPTSYREVASKILDVLRQVVVPRIQDDPETIGVVSTLVESIANQGLPVAAVLPVMQTIQPDRDVAPELRRALASHEPDVYSSALRGLVHWFELRHGRRSSAAITLPEPPWDLLRELGMIVASRRQPGFLEALRVVAWLLEDCPDTAADTHFLNSIVVALDYLRVETEYRPFGSDSDRIPYSEVPEYREKAARIASLLQKTPAAENETVRQWIATASNDPLPEVRRAVATASESGRPISVDEMLRLIESSIPDWISSAHGESLLASLLPLLQQAEFSSSLGVVPSEERLQLAALLVARVAQTVSSVKAARSAIGAIVSHVLSSRRRLSDAELSKLRAIGMRDDRAQPDDTLIWLRKWMSGTNVRGKKSRRSNKGKRSRQPRRRSP